MVLRAAFISFIVICLFTQPVFAESKSIGPSVEELLAKREVAKKRFSTSAVVLSRRGEVTVDQQGFEKSHYYNAIYIVDDSAVNDYSKLISSFNSYYQKKQIDFARVITADGKVIEMQEDAITLASSNNDDYFDEGKQYEFALPQLKAGSIIEYQATTQQIKPYIENEWFSSISFHYVKFLPNVNWLRIDPVLETKNSVTLPLATEVAIANYNIDIAPEVINNADTKTYHWQTENQPGLVLEMEMPSLDDILPSIHLTTVKNWRTINDWFNELYLPTQASDVAISALAKQLFHQDMSEYDKVKAVFDYMQKNVRYIGAHVNRGGYQPHLASEVLSQAYGDCKDQTVLIIALLKQAGISAYPAMINTYPGAKFDDNLPMLNFDHMITYVETKTDKYWLDTSGQTGTFPGISLNLEDKKAFVVNEDSGEILKLPSTTSADNVATINIEFEESNAKLSAKVSLALSGHVETNLRNFMQFSPNALAAAEQIISPLLYNRRISDFENSNPLDVTKPFTMSANFKDVVELTSDIDNFRYGYDFSSFLSVFTTLSNLSPIASRKLDFSILQPITVVINSYYPLPWPSAELAFRQPAQNIQNEFYSLTHEVSEKADGVYLTSTFVLPKQLIKVSDYAKLYNQVHDFAEHSQSLFIYKKLVAPDQALASNGAETEAKILQAKELLEKSQFSEALMMIQEVVKANEKHAEAQYLLGIAFGFNGNDIKSEQAFSRAEQLGYQF